MDAIPRKKQVEEMGLSFKGLIFVVLATTAVAISIHILYGVLMTHIISVLKDRSHFVQVFGTVDTLFSGLALGSVIVAIFLQRHELHLLKQQVAFDMEQRRNERYASLEGNLASNGCESAFALYSIDLKDAERDGVTPAQIAHLVSLIYILIADADTRGKRIQEFIDEPGRDYWRLLFKQKQTRKAWKYARIFHSKRWRRQIDQYLLEEYGDTFPGLPLERRMDEIARACVEASATAGTTATGE